MPIDPTELANSIGALDPERGLARTLQQVTDGAKRLFRADAAGLMLIDQEGQLRWASASDQTAQTLERTTRSASPKARVRWRSASGCRRPSATSTPNRTPARPSPADGRW